MMCSLKGLCSELVCHAVMFLLPILLQTMRFFASVQFLWGEIGNVYCHWLEQGSFSSLLVHRDIESLEAETCFILWS